MCSSATEEYPLKNMRQVFVHGRIPSQKHGASIRPSTNTFSKSWGKYSYCGQIPSPKHRAIVLLWMNTLSATWGKYSSVDEYHLFDEWISRVFVKSIRIRAGCDFSCSAFLIEKLDDFVRLREHFARGYFDFILYFQHVDILIFCILLFFGPAPVQLILVWGRVHHEWVHKI